MKNVTYEYIDACYTSIIIVISSIATGLPKKAQQKLKDVAAYSKKCLSDIPRRSGESYAEHCFEVANVLREANDDTTLLSVALLHDLLVHPDAKDLLSNAPLEDEEIALVENMYLLRRLHIDKDTHDLDLVMDAFLEMPELLPLRMAHRLNDVRHIQRFSSSLQKQIARETLHMYSAIAGRLGFHRWRLEMEDGSFPLVQPKIALNLQQKFSAVAQFDNVCLSHAKAYLEKQCKQYGLRVNMETRLKGLYSSYRKMVIKQRTFEDLTDRLAIRLITEHEEDCYRALGIVHRVMHPIPGKLKDYIGAPKENGYQSIHTVVYPLPGVTEQPIEIQIRTKDMHRLCEFGSAAHGQYKSSMYALTAKNSRVNLFRNLQSLREESHDPKQFEEALRNYFSEDHIAVFDSENTLYHFRKPVSVLDMVCHVYGRKVLRVKQVKINGRKRPFATLLQDGDTVEAIFGRKNVVKKEWKAACYYKSSKELL